MMIAKRRREGRVEGRIERGGMVMMEKMTVILIIGLSEAMKVGKIVVSQFVDYCKEFL